MTQTVLSKPGAIGFRDDTLEAGAKNGNGLLYTHVSNKHFRKDSRVYSLLIMEA